MAEPKVAAIMSVGRIEFTDNANCALVALSQAGVSLCVRPGLFWEQHIQNGLNQLVEEGYDYIFGLDYDTLFTPRDVQELLRLIQANPQVDAICPVQMRRQHDTVLLREIGQPTGGIKSADYSGELTQIWLGHFGLTVFCAASFKDFPKPWLIAIPSPKGEWDDDRQDPDIYFWGKWGTHKKTLYQANRVRVGHLQLVATWPGKDFRPVHQYMNDYRTNGPPQEVLDQCK